MYYVWKILDSITAVNVFVLVLIPALSHEGLFFFSSLMKPLPNVFFFFMLRNVE